MNDISDLDVSHKEISKLASERGIAPSKLSTISQVACRLINSSRRVDLASGTSEWV